jgi:uncharacterized protein (UPF0276 family)
VRFFEIAPENYARRGDWIGEAVHRVADSFPVLSHGLSLSLGGTDDLDTRLIGDLRTLLGELRVPWHSDHLCFTSEGGAQLHELLPIPWSDSSAVRTAERVARVQDELGLPIAVENVTYYAHAGTPSLPETEFICRVLDQAKCGLLLDLNNIHVNAHNHGFDPWEWLRQVPLEKVAQIHVAGPDAWDGDFLVDTHGTPVPPRVRDMLSWVIERTGPVPVLLERDHSMPRLDELLVEVESLQAVYDAALQRRLQRGGAHAA